MTSADTQEKMCPRGLLGRVGVQAARGVPVIPALTRRGRSASVLLPGGFQGHSGKEVEKALTVHWASSNTGPLGSREGASSALELRWRSWLSARPLPSGLGVGLQRGLWALAFVGQLLS